MLKALLDYLFLLPVVEWILSHLRFTTNNHLNSSHKSTPKPTSTPILTSANKPTNLLILSSSNHSTNLHTMSDPNATSNGHGTTQEASFYHNSVELADLGIKRFDQDTAAIGDHDFALHANQPVITRAGRAPRGLESQVHAWNTFQYTTDEVDSREELKGDLHGGQLHRENRAAANPQGMAPMDFSGGRGRGFERGGRAGARGGRAGGAGRGGVRDDGQMEGLCAGRKPDFDAPPMAKGMAEEMDKSMFWDEPIV
jgi:hypothetical protein